MTATINDPYWDCAGNGAFDEELAIASLLRDGVLFVNSADYSYEGKRAGHTTMLFVLCNDLFIPAADSQDLPIGQIEELYLANQADPDWGVALWVARQRNMQPWSRVKNRMIKKGVWSEEREKLPLNPL